jgi:hypothetical protein
MRDLSLKHSTPADEKMRLGSMLADKIVKWKWTEVVGILNVQASAFTSSGQVISCCTID